MRFSRQWLWLLLLIPIGLGLARLRFDVEVLNLLPSESRVVQGLKLYQQNFSNGRELIITLKSLNADTTEAAARGIVTTLRKATNLVAHATWQPPWQEHPAQSAELIAYLWFNQNPKIFGMLTNHLSGENLTNILTEAREQLTSSLSPNEIAFRGYDPLGLAQLPEHVTGGASPLGNGQELFASLDGTFRIVFVEPRNSLANYHDSIAWMNSIRSIVSELRRSDGALQQVEIGYTGGSAFVAEIAGGMEKDLAGPSAGTLIVIALLFYITHRRWLPLIWLIILLLLILGGSLALGAFFLGTLNVVSLAFAAILLGLAEDFGIVLYQESKMHPELSAREIRRMAAPGIFWSAVTTAGAFFLLNLSGLPGLGQLGSLVAIGIGLAAIVMLYAYLPPLLRFKKPPAVSPDPHGVTAGTSGQKSDVRQARTRWIVTGLLLVGGILVLWKWPPPFDQSPDALRPQKSQAYAAMAEIKHNLIRKQEPLWLVIQGQNEQEVAEKIKQVEPVLEDAISNRLIASFTLPAALWPKPDYQTENRETARNLAAKMETLRNATLQAGFASNAFGLTESILNTWKRAAQTTVPRRDELHESQIETFWPTNENSQWVMEKISAHNTNGFFALGLAQGRADLEANTSELLAFNGRLPDKVWLSGWELIGPSVSELIFKELPKVLIPICLLVFISLWLAFRNWKDVLLSLATLILSGLCLIVVMKVIGWSWNLMNLMAVPLLLGMGVDFSIHMQLALRRYAGNWEVVAKSIGRALLLAGSTTVAGFASLAFSTNAGIASLGKLCAAGIACAMFTAIYLLPVWWLKAHRKEKLNSPD